MSRWDRWLWRVALVVGILIGGALIGREVVVLVLWQRDVTAAIQQLQQRVRP